jgi:DNA mismatch repair protein MutL
VKLIPSISRSPILALSPDVAERIAAGEVIERPVSVVKELVENALDAGAHEIRVEVRGGGLRLIRVTDDGYGIPEDELERACARHTTSKISTVEDLSRLYTLGFRGEALASIAAVSELTLLSRAIETEALVDDPGLLRTQANQGEEHPAVWLTLRGGELTQRGRRARLHGTTVTVRDLFYNVPARLKFMRGARTEAGHILQLLQRYAAGYPAVRFNLVIEEHIALQTAGSGDLATTLAELYHLPLAELLNPISVSFDPQTPQDAVGASAKLAEHVSILRPLGWGEAQLYTLHGYVGNRALAQPNRQHITLFINGRWVQSRPLQDALEAGYRGLLPKGKHPLLVFHIDLPAEELDVNVHPAKTEVRLVREAEVAASLTQAVRSVLERSPVLPEAVQFPGPTLIYQRRLPGSRRRGLHLAESASEYSAESAPPGAAEVLLSLRPLAQLQQAVILAEAPDGSLCLIDQHRAHERMIYEHLRRIYTRGQTDKKEFPAINRGSTDAHLLLEPMIIELRHREAELFEQRLPMLRGLGLECERFGGRSFLVRSVPSITGQEQLVGHLHELAEIASEDSADWEDHLLIGLACRSALRRGRHLGPDEQRSLLTALAETTAPAVCPHGSPILLHYSRAFLVDKFDW